MHRKSLVPDGLSQKCRRAVMDIRPIYSDLHADILESCIIALVNKSDWEFVMSMAGGPSLPMEVQVSQLLLSIVICTKVCTVHESQEGCSISMNECHEV